MRSKLDISCGAFVGAMAALGFIAGCNGAYSVDSAAADAGVDASGDSAAAPPDGGTSGPTDASAQKDAAVSDGVADSASATKKRIFVTSTLYAGNLGGLAGADTKCQTVADSANLGAHFVAWASDIGTDAIDRIADVGPWFGSDQATLLFTGKTSGTNPLTSDPISGVTRDEAGHVLHPNTFYWTGTKSGGMATNTDCSQWTVGTGSATGNGGETGSVPLWSFTGGNAACNTPGALLCIEQ